MMVHLKDLKNGDLIEVKYFDHYSDVEECDKDYVAGCVGYSCGVIKCKRPLLKLAQSDDLSCPWTYIIVGDIDSIHRLTRHRE